MLAKANGRSERQIERMLADPAARVGARNRIYYVERAPSVEAAATETSLSAAAEPAALPDSQTFQLHSRPGSQRVIYLDFDGHTVAGTAWNEDAGVASFDAEPLSIDDLPTFSAAERAIVRDIWKRVSEDFAIFDVDVTTEDPGEAAINRSDVGDQRYGTRALITDTHTLADDCGCAGMAFVGAFGEPDGAYFLPALVFSRGLRYSPKSIAEVVSHEVGHNLGLLHDGTNLNRYYTGHGTWAPIMGTGYFRPVTQWSKGEYDQASNTEDDIAIIQAAGAALLPDDHGDTAAGATVLEGALNRRATGLITTDQDLDVFRLTTPAPGVATLLVSPAPISPNLDLRLEVRSADGAVVASADPLSQPVSIDKAAGLDASLRVALAAETDYFLYVSGVGTGSATTGYSGYGSLGHYTLAAGLNQPTVTIASSANPSSLSYPPTFTATVEAPDLDGGTPTGTLTFHDGQAVLCGDVPISGGRATCKAAPGAGNRLITARYGGNPTFSEAVSPALAHRVIGDGSAVVVSSSPNPSVRGERVTYEAIVSPRVAVDGVPTGTVTFNPTSSTPLCTAVALSNGRATCSSASQSGGTHPIDVAYSGDDRFDPSRSTVLSQSIMAANTAVALRVTPDPSPSKSVTLTASLSAIAPGSGTPWGNVTFMEGETALCSSSARAGQASCRVTLTRGSHELTAVYAGTERDYRPSTSAPIVQVVDGDPSRVAVTSSPNPSVSGQPVTVRATVSAAGGTGTPAGTVTFTDGGSISCTGVVLVAGEATCPMTPSAGSHSLSAAYSGDDRFAGSASPVQNHAVGPAGTTVVLTSSSNPAPTTPGPTLTASVSVNAPGAGALTGTVTFKTGSIVLCPPVALTAGSATCSPTLPAGTHPITAVYSGSSELSPATSAVLNQVAVAPGNMFVPMAPARLLDTRSGLGGPAVPLGAHSTRELVVRGGTTGVPETATAVVLNLTATAPTAASYLTVFPTGVAPPTASNLNFVAGQTIPNLVMTGIGTGGRISIFNAAGSVHVLADVAGYYTPSGGATFTPLQPARLLDTRNGTGGPAAPLSSGQTRELLVRGSATGIPQDATAVVLNTTVTTPSSPGYLTVHPSGGARPVTSNLNFTANQTIPNLVVVGVGTGSKISIYNAAGTVHVLADVVGYFSPTGGTTFKAVTPARLLDTRIGIGGPAAPVTAGATRTLTAANEPAGIPTGAKAVVLNTTAVSPSAPGYLTMYPSGAGRPTTSNLNFLTGQVIPNLVVVAVGENGQISIFNAAGSVHVIADVVGFMT